MDIVLALEAMSLEELSPALRTLLVNSRSLLDDLERRSAFLER
jgi:hypothetical protein